MKKWVRNLTLGVVMTSMLGITACTGKFKDSTTGEEVTIEPDFGKVAIVEYANNSTKFVDYDGKEWTYPEIVDRQITAMASSIAKRLYSIYGEETPSTSPITIENKLVPGSTFHTVAKNDQVVTANDYTYSGTIKSTMDDANVSSSGIGDITVNADGTVSLNQIVKNEYKKYYRDYYNVGNSFYGVVSSHNQASTFDNLATLLYAMNNDGTGTIKHVDIDEQTGSNADNPYTLDHILNFHNTINSTHSWTVTATYNNNGTTEDATDDYYTYAFTFDNVQESFDTSEESGNFKVTTQSQVWKICEENNGQAINIETLTNVLKRYMASIIVSQGTESVYLSENVFDKNAEDAYVKRCQNITLTDNWIDSYYDHILKVLKSKIIGDYIWDSQETYRNYLQQLSDDLYATFKDVNVDFELQEGFFKEDNFIVPVLEYRLKHSNYIKEFYKFAQGEYSGQSVIESDFVNAQKLYLQQYLTARNYQGIDLIVPAILSSCADATISSEVGDETEQSAWFISSKSNIDVRDSQDDLGTGDDFDALPAKQYQSMLFFAKQAVDLTKDHSIYIIFGNVEEKPFAVKPVITVVSGVDVNHKTITTLSADEYEFSTITAPDSDFVNDDRTTGMYVVKVDDDYQNGDMAGFELDLKAGSIASAGYYNATKEPTIVKNDWILNGNPKTAILNAVNYIQISFEFYSLDGQPLGETIEFGFNAMVLNA